MDPHLRQMKDFLQLFNKISETCFHQCVVTFVDRETTDNEIICVDRCITKYIGLNHKLMSTYVEVQPEIVKKRMEEMERQANTIQQNAALNETVQASNS